MRGDAGHRKGRATRSESSEKTQVLSPLGRVGGRQQALEMSRIAPGSTCGLLPTRRDPGAIPMGHCHQDLVSFVPVRPGTYEFYVEGMQADGILSPFVVK